jgi:hypothetical protein
MPFEPKGKVEDRREEESVGDLTESGLKYYGQKAHGLLPPFDPSAPGSITIPPPTPLGRELGAVSPPIPFEERMKEPYTLNKDEINYETRLSPEEEKGYQKWAKSVKRSPKDEEKDYDLKGYYKDVVRGNPDLPPYLQDSVQYHRDQLAKTGGKGHLPDMYKKPNHPTFSDESVYHGFPTQPEYQPLGGHWDEKDKTFTPSSTNMEHWPRERLQSYFNKHEPEYKVRFPDWYK